MHQALYKKGADRAEQLLLPVTGQSGEAASIKGDLDFGLLIFPGPPKTGVYLFRHLNGGKRGVLVFSSSSDALLVTENTTVRTTLMHYEDRNNKGGHNKKRSRLAGQLATDFL